MKNIRKIAIRIAVILLICSALFFTACIDGGSGTFPKGLDKGIFPQDLNNVGRPSSGLNKAKAVKYEDWKNYMSQNVETADSLTVMYSYEAQGDIYDISGGSFTCNMIQTINKKDKIMSFECTSIYDGLGEKIDGVPLKVALYWFLYKGSAYAVAIENPNSGIVYHNYGFGGEDWLEISGLVSGCGVSEENPYDNIWERVYFYDGWDLVTDGGDIEELGISILKTDDILNYTNDLEWTIQHSFLYSYNSGVEYIEDYYTYDEKNSLYKYTMNDEDFMRNRSVQFYADGGLFDLRETYWDDNGSAIPNTRHYTETLTIHILENSINNTKVTIPDSVIADVETYDKDK